MFFEVSQFEVGMIFLATSPIFFLGDVFQIQKRGRNCQNEEASKALDRFNPPPKELSLISELLFAQILQARGLKGQAAVLGGWR